MTSWEGVALVRILGGERPRLGFERQEMTVERFAEEVKLEPFDISTTPKPSRAELPASQAPVRLGLQSEAASGSSSPDKGG
jgi:hypothetical protein